jgi:hypothetical protein
MPLAGQDLPVCGESSVLARAVAAAARAFACATRVPRTDVRRVAHNLRFCQSFAFSKTTRTEGDMLWTIFVILLVLWLLGMVSSYTLGGFIHVLLIIAIAVVLIQLITGRRAV